MYKVQKRVFRRVSVSILFLVACLLFICGQIPGNAKAPKATLEYWHLFTEGVAEGEANTKLINMFNEAHPNVKIKGVFYENTPFKTQLRIALGTPAGPDIFFVWTGRTYLFTFVDAGQVLNLDRFYEKYGWNEKLFSYAVAATKYEGHRWGVPFRSSIEPVWYNKVMFAKYGLTPPRIWSEWYTVCDKFLGQNIPPLVMGAKNRWPLGHYWSYIVSQTAGKKLIDKVLKGETTWDREEFIVPMQIIKDMVDREYFYMGATGMRAMTDIEASSIFTAQQIVPMYSTGNWFLTREIPEDFDFGAFRFPEITKETYPNKDPNVLWRYLGGIDSLNISSKTKHPDVAAEFINWFVSPEGQKIWGKGGKQIVVNKEVYSKELVSLGRFAELIKEGMSEAEETGLMPWMNVQMHPKTDSVLANGRLAVLVGEMGPEELMEEVQRTAERIRARQE